MSHIQKFTGLILLCLFSNSTLAADRLLVAVASNMSFPMTDIATSFHQETETQAKLTFGSSGNFARQIIQGAPFKLFLSADKQYVELLKENGLKILSDVKYARGRIGFFIPNGSPMFSSENINAIIKLLIHGDYKRLTIANPDHAPYGLAAQQALQSAGLWVMEKKRLLLAENAAQAMQIALSGNVDVGIIPASFIHLSAIKDKGRFLLIPEHWHQPLQQHLVLLEGANNTEKQFFEYMQNEQSDSIVENYGYSTQ